MKQVTCRGEIQAIIAVGCQGMEAPWGGQTTHKRNRHFSYDTI